MRSSILVVCLLAGVFSSSALELVETPCGARPRECVLEVPSGTTVVEDEKGEGVQLSHPSLGSWYHRTPEICHDPMYRAAHMQKDVRSAGDPSCDAPPCSCDTLPCNNWIDNGGAMTGDQIIGGMSSTYSVPQTPPSGDAGQTLFYFIGAENTDGTPRGGNPPPSGRAILQPVLTYDPSSWCGGSETGWCFASWYCCPSNLTTHSTYDQQVKPFQSYVSFFNLTEPDLFEVVGRNQETGVVTSLQAPRQGRNFNWFDVTLEVYSMQDCDNFAKGPMTFSDIQTWDVNYQPYKKLDWLFTSEKPCKGSITYDAANRSMTVEHANSQPAFD